MPAIPRQRAPLPRAPIAAEAAPTQSLHACGNLSAWSGPLWEPAMPAIPRQRATLPPASIALKRLPHKARLRHDALSHAMSGFFLSGFRLPAHPLPADRLQ